jgi:hypothetical protein
MAFWSSEQIKKCYEREREREKGRKTLPASLGTELQQPWP